MHELSTVQEAEVNVVADSPSGLADAVNAHLAVVQFTPEGSITEVNDNFLKLLGFARAEVVGAHHRSIVDPREASEPTYAEFWTKLANGQAQRGEFKRVGKNGTPVWVTSEYLPIRDERGKVSQIIALSQDITERKRAALRRESILSALDRTQAVISFKPDGTILEANENFLQATGYTLGEVQGQHHRIFCEPAFVESLDYRRMWTRLASGESFSGEFKRKHKDGRDIWTQATYNPIVDESGHVEGVIKFATDITEKKLQAAENAGRLDAINSVQAVIEFEPDGTIVKANDNFLQTVGYTQDEIAGRHHRMFCSPEYAKSDDYQQFWRDLANGKSRTGEFLRFAKDGSEVWINASYNPLKDFSGRVTKVVKYASDVTEMKRIADRVQMVDKSPINTMMATPDGTLTYLNEASLTTLRSLQQYLPDRVENLRGQKIDIFHKRPEHQRGIISDPKNLPHRAKIALGPETLDLNVSAIVSGDRYIGAMVTWDVVTANVNLVKQLTEAATQLSAAASELNAAAVQMSASSEETSAKSTAAAAASEQVARGVEIVATNTEEMQVSVKEISRNASEASAKSNETSTQAQETNTVIQKLGASSQEIGQVIKVISSIAQQTNLLALNATIEAARAGDAGRGFAVVANEVKELAKQTAVATEDITQKISAIQTDTDGAVKAIGGIGESIERLNSIAGSIAASVEEQLATTNEVARVVQESNTGVRSIATNVRSVSEAAQENSRGSSQVLEAAKQLQGLAETLQELVKQVKV